VISGYHSISWFDRQKTGTDISEHVPFRDLWGLEKETSVKESEFLDTVLKNIQDKN